MPETTQGQVRQTAEAPVMSPGTQRAAVRFHFLSAAELIQEECNVGGEVPARTPRHGYSPHLLRSGQAARDALLLLSWPEAVAGTGMPLG